MYHVRAQNAEISSVNRLNRANGTSTKVSRTSIRITNPLQSLNTHGSGCVNCMGRNASTNGNRCVQGIACIRSNSSN